MNSSAEQLRKILLLERDKGCGDVAVIGGLDKFLSRWKEGKQAARLSRLLSQSYAAMTQTERQEWIDKVLKLLAKRDSKRPGQSSASQVSLSQATAQSPDAPITTIKGISSSLAARFGRLGVSTVRDILYFFPRRHLDYSTTKFISELEVGIEQTIVANIWQASEKTMGRSRRGTEAIVGDETGNIRVIWFNQPYLAKRLPTNAKVVISGKVGLFSGRKVFESPEYELLEKSDLIHTGRLVPVYPLTEGLYARQVRKLIKETVDRWASKLPDFVPQEVRNRVQLIELPAAIKQAHYPDDELSKDRARKRLAFDELFLIQLGVLAKRRDWQESQPASPIKANYSWLQAFLKSLPFSLTPAQHRVLDEITEDIGKPKPMSRLLQGEVGSGKTVVAIAAMLHATANGYQASLMAPTEILAEQHFETICQLLAGPGEQGQKDGFLRTYSSLFPHPVSVALLVGSIRESQKHELQRRISEGEVDIVIGTHALIQKGVEFKQLGLVVVDEQHRFGVMQRAALRHKGTNPHALVMSATPIPRTLALTLYGDLDISVIDELPPGRLEVKTRWLNPGQRQSAYNFLRTEVRAGRQAFVICPLIEESLVIEAKAALTEYERLCQDVFPDLQLGLLHGRMPTSEKDEAMRQFRAGGFDILVSTPVVEVGIDVANATVMLVESADRFGLSQLHQFRGRVRRSSHPSYCLLLAETPSPEGRERLAIIERTQDGFILAEEDLRLRGPGEFFGTRQSGLPDLRMARLSDVKLLELARNEAIRLFRDDPWLKKPEHGLLAEEMSQLWQNGGEWS